MNSRIACLLLFVIAHAPASAAPKFPVKLYAAISQREGITALTWSHDGKTLASNGLGAKFNDRGEEESIRQLLLWDAEKWGRKPKDRILINNGEMVMEVGFFDPDNSNRLALGFTDRAKGGWSYGILNLKRPKDKPRIIGKGVQYSPRGGLIGSREPNWSRDGRKVAFNSFSGLSIIDPESGKILHALNKRNAREVLSPGRRDFGADTDWSPDGKYLVTNTGKSVVVFDAKLEEELFRFDPFGPNPNSNAGTLLPVEWNPNGTEIAFIGIAKNVSFIDMKGLEENEEPVGAGSRYIRDKPDRSFLMKDGKGNPITGPRGLRWGPQGRRIAVAASSFEKRPGGGTNFDPTIFIYSKGGTLLHELAVKDVFHPGNRNPGKVHVARLEWSPDGFMIAAGLDDGTIRVFKTLK